MRNHVIDRITELASTDPRIMLVVGDLGFSVVEKFRDKYPDRFVNVGIAEQNMSAVAAGLAIEGNMVFTYSIGNFPTLRCLEQIRNDICYHNANVKILAVGGGFAYGDLGMTHHATEDIAIMRALPNMRVYVPSDEVDAVDCLNDACSFDGPAYIRMARGKETVFHKESVDVSRIDEIVSPGEDINILTCGTVLSEGIELQKILSCSGKSVGLFSIPRVKPIDRASIEKLAIQSDLLITIEEHNTIGGLGGSVAEVLSSIRCPHASLYRAGLNDTFTEVVGNQQYLRNYYKLSASKIADEVKKIPNGRNRVLAVSGASSFLGLKLIRKATENGWECIAIVRKNCEKLHLLKAIPGARIVECNMEDYARLGCLVGPVDCFVHFAWDGTRGSSRLDEDRQKQNYIFSMEAIKSMIKAGCRKIVTAGSQAEYGLNYGTITEDTPCKPNTAYGKYKLKLYLDSYELCRENGVSIIEPRFFSLYGPDDYKDTMVISMLKCMLENKDCELTQCIQEWDFLYVDDALEGILCLCEKECPDGVYNFGSGDCRALKAFVEEMKDITGSSSRLLYGAVPYGPAGMVSICPSIEKMKKETGWNAKTSFREGIYHILNNSEAIQKK